MQAANSHRNSQLAKAEATVQDLEAKLQHTRSILAERLQEREQMGSMEQKIRNTGDINKMIQVQSRVSALDKVIADLKQSDAESERQIESARRYLYTLYVKLERLRQEAAAFREKSLLENALQPEDQANLRRLQVQIQAITGLE